MDISAGIFLPEGFRELLSGVFSMIAVLSLSGLPFRRSRLISQRLLGTFLIASITLFTDNWMVFLAATLIIATLVTSTDFLESIAAIIRGNKDYFRYRIRPQRKKELGEHYKTKYAELSGTGARSMPHFTNNAPVGSFENYYMLEQLALQYFEEETGSTIKRNVVIEKNGNELYLDGLAGTADAPTDSQQQQEHDIVLKVKIVNEIDTGEISCISENAKKDLNRYREMTGRKAAAVAAIITLNSSNTKEAAGGKHRQGAKHSIKSYSDLYSVSEVTAEVLPLESIMLREEKSY